MPDPLRVLDFLLFRIIMPLSVLLWAGLAFIGLTYTIVYLHLHWSL